MAKSTGNARAENMIVLGALAHLVSMSQSIMEDFVRERFTRGRPNDEQIISSNIEALTLGRQEAEKSGFSLGELAPAIMPEGNQILINGNEAVLSWRLRRRHQLLHRIPNIPRNFNTSMDGAQPHRRREVRLSGKFRD